MSGRIQTNVNFVSCFAAILLLTGCGDQSTHRSAVENGVSKVAEIVNMEVGDGRRFVPASMMWNNYKKGSLLCYSASESRGSCKSVEYAETITNDKAVLLSFEKFDAFQKHVYRLKMSLKGEYICSAVDDWAVEHSSTYVTSDDTPQLKSGDISHNPGEIARWRNDMRERSAGVMGQENCYRYALRKSAKGGTSPGEFEEFKYIDGVLQPKPEPTYFDLYNRGSLAFLHLRPAN